MAELERKRIGGTEIKGGEGPSPSPTPIKDFMKEHRRIKRILEKGECIRVNAIATQTKLSGDKVREHLDVFLADGYIHQPVKEEDAVCSSEALIKLRDAFKQMRRE